MLFRKLSPGFADPTCFILFTVLVRLSFLLFSAVWLYLSLRYVYLPFNKPNRTNIIIITKCIIVPGPSQLFINNS